MTDDEHGGLLARALKLVALMRGRWVLKRCTALKEAARVSCGSDCMLVSNLQQRRQRLERLEELKTIVDADVTQGSEVTSETR